MESLKFAEGAEVCAVEANVIAVERGEEAGGIGEFLHGAEGADGGRVVEGFWVPFDVAVDLIGDAGGFESPGAELTPPSRGQLFDEGHFGFGFGFEFGDEGGEVPLEAFGGFSLNDEGLREEAVFGGVFRGSGFAFP